MIIAADEVAKVLKESGVQSNKEELDVMIRALSGKKLHELVAAGTKKLASVPSGGAAASSAGKSPVLAGVFKTIFS